MAECQLKRKARHQQPRFPCRQQLHSNCVWNSMKNKMAGFVRSRWMKRKSENKRKSRRAEAQRERERERERAKLKVSKSAWPRKIHEAKNSICHFICDGRLEALCHMTYPSYRTRRDTSIHLFRHLTCLERGTERKTEREREWIEPGERRGEERRGEERRGEERRGKERRGGGVCNKASLLALVFSHILLTYMTTRQWARHIISHYFTLPWFPTHTCSRTQEQKERAWVCLCSGQLV